MRPPDPVQRFVAHRGLHRRSPWRRSHTSAPPRTAPRGPIRSFTEGPAFACATPVQYSASWPHRGGFTNSHNGVAP
eukprot:2109183-Pyramimonas_sp.AAC.1